MLGQGQNIEESISCALILKRIGVPWVIAKAETDIHGEILTKVGADRIVFPESEAGDQVAHSLEIRHHVAYMNLTRMSGVARMELPATAVGQTVGQIDEARPNVSIILIQRGNFLLPRPAADTHCWKGTSSLSRDLTRRSTRSPTVRRLVAGKPGHITDPDSAGDLRTAAGRTWHRRQCAASCTALRAGFRRPHRHGDSPAGAAMGNEITRTDPFVDAFFTSVSASSVTGLSSSTHSNTGTGRDSSSSCVLTQTGGLGFIGRRQHPPPDAAPWRRRVYPARRDLAQRRRTRVLNSGSRLARRADRAIHFPGRDRRRLAARRLVWHGGGHATADALWNGLFHAVSAFCNAGFDSPEAFVRSDQRQPTSGSTSC